jgi:hypothetical protein
LYAACSGDLDVSIGDDAFLDTTTLNFTNLTCSTQGAKPIVLTYTNALAGSVYWTSNYTVDKSGVLF